MCDSIKMSGISLAVHLQTKKKTTTTTTAMKIAGRLKSEISTINSVRKNETQRTQRFNSISFQLEQRPCMNNNKNTNFRRKFSI